MVTVALPPDIAAWAEAEGFLLLDADRCEICYPTWSDAVTFRLMALHRHPDDRGCWVILKTTNGAVNVGVCESLTQVQTVYGALRSLELR